MHKIFGVIVVILVSLLLFTGCFDKKEEKKEPENSKNTEFIEEIEAVPIYREFDTDFNMEESYEKISGETKLTLDERMSNEEAESAYKLSELDGITYDIRKNNDYEVAIIKLKNTDQSPKAFELISSRVKALKLSIDDYYAEQNDGVVTFVVGKNAAGICNKLTESLMDK